MKEPKAVVPVAYLVAYLLLQYKGSILCVRPLGNPEADWEIPYVEMTQDELPQGALLNMAHERFGLTLQAHEIPLVHTNCLVEHGAGESTVTLFFAAKRWENHPQIPKLGLTEVMWRRPEEAPEEFPPELLLPLAALDQGSFYSEMSCRPTTTRTPHLHLVRA